MSLQLASLAVIALAVVLGIVRSLRASGGRRWVLVAGQLLMGASFALFQYPPSIEQDQQTAVVLAAGTTASQLRDLAADATVIILPEASNAMDAGTRAVDLASALRQQPGIGSLRVLGDGLSARDREAARGLGVRFEPLDEPAGLVELQTPDAVSAGTVWTLSGRIAGMAEARVELLDRSGAIVDATAVDADGRFRLSAAARSGSRMLYQLRVFDADDRLVEEVPVAIAARPQETLNAVVVAGAPDAELKYLRRWIVDAGHSLGSQVTLSRGIEQRQSAARLDPASLAETDLLIVDERAWSGLPADSRENVRNAVESGMGLLLRITGPVPQEVARDWAAMGFRLEDADRSRSIELSETSAGRDQKRTFSRRQLALDAPDSVSLLQAADGSDLARWRAIGRGRVGVTLLLDSFRMALDGDSESYGTLWSKMFSTLARARAEVSPQLPRDARVNQRSVICGLQPGSVIVDAQGEFHELLVDSDARSCAAWWPDTAGWHVLQNAGRDWAIHVLDHGQAETLQRMENRQATLAMASDASATQRFRSELPRWPFFILWLSLAALVWWLERRKPR